MDHREIENTPHSEPLSTDSIRSVPSAPASPTALTEHNLVMNEYVFYEKSQRAQVQLSDQQRASVGNRSWLTVIGVVVVVFAILLSIAPVPDFTGLFLMITALGSCVFMVVMLFMSTVQRRGFPTNIGVTEEGITFKWWKDRQYSSPVFKWTQVISASIFQLPVFEGSGLSVGKFLKVTIDTDKLMRHQHWWLWTSGAKLKHNVSLPFEHNEFYFDRVVFEIPLDSLTRDSDQKLLLDLVTKFLGAEKVGNSLNLESSEEVVPGFTRLWLDEAQSFRRRNIESLAVDSSLQEGRYLVIERIASGGQATVYRALDTAEEPPRVVVLKELVLPVSAGNDVRKRSFESVKNEALLLAGLKHPGIIELYDNFVEDHRAYLVLENVEGTTLRDLVQDAGPLPEAQVRPMISQLCEILGYLHGLTPPVVHRDLTPDNLILTDVGNVKLLDFNVALQSESSSTKTVVGKHHYIAPEQFRGKPCPQSDLYSLGATIYYLLTGKDPVSLKMSTLVEAGLPDSSLDEIVRKLTAMELSDRYASVGELADALSQPNS